MGMCTARLWTSVSSGRVIHADSALLRLSSQALVHKDRLCLKLGASFGPQHVRYVSDHGYSGGVRGRYRGPRRGALR